MHAAPRGALLYRRFVDFNFIPTCGENDSLVYTSGNEPDIYSIFELKDALECCAEGIRRKEDMREAAYRELDYNRLVVMLKAAAFFRYRHLILGAWGCGSYGNDASVISDLFRRALNELDFNRFKEKDLFSKIDFAVQNRTLAQFNYRQFKRNFGN